MPSNDYKLGPNYSSNGVNQNTLKNNQTTDDSDGEKQTDSIHLIPQSQSQLNFNRANGDVTVTKKRRTKIPQDTSDKLISRNQIVTQSHDSSIMNSAGPSSFQLNGPIAALSQDEDQDFDFNGNLSDDPLNHNYQPNQFHNPFFFGQPDDKLEPYQMKHDDSVKWAYRPSTLTGAAFGTTVLAVLAYNSHIFPRTFRSHLGVISGIVVFLIFCMLNFRDGPFRRPHPAFWRVVLGLNLLYFMLLSFLYWTDKSTARELIKYFDPSLGVPLPEKSYAENCEFTPQNVWNGIDIFCLAHSLGWFAKAVVLRDHWFCWILSIGFEVMEYSLQHHLPNFAECWWDHWLLDVLLCNWGGLWLGMKTCEWLRVSPFSWRGLRPVNDNPSSTRRRAKYAARQFTPHDWTEFRWEGTKRFRNYISTVALLTVFLLSELNVFYLKSLLWLAPEHPIVILRLAAMFLWALPAVREFYDYATYAKRVKRMGSHAWLSMATVILELLIVIKWSKGEFESSIMPLKVKIFWTITLVLLFLYPVIKFGLPSLSKQPKPIKQPSSNNLTR